MFGVSGRYPDGYSKPKLDAFGILIILGKCPENCRTAILSQHDMVLATF